MDKLVEVLLAAGEVRLVEDKLEEHLHLGEDFQEDRLGEHLHLGEDLQEDKLEDRLATLGKEVSKKIEK